MATPIPSLGIGATQILFSSFSYFSRRKKRFAAK
jgi:hypothetical protein